MARYDHNNTKIKDEISRGPDSIKSLGELCDFIRVSDLSEEERSQITSAIKRVDELIGHGALDLAADGRKIMTKLDQLSPAMAGMTRGSWANVKSRVRKALRLAANRIVALRNRPPLRPEWQFVKQQLDGPQWRDLSRFSHFASSQGWLPQEITDAHLERFRVHLSEVLLVAGWENVAKQTIRAWNKAASAATCQLPRLSPPVPKRTSYWVDENQLPVSLREEFSKILTELADPPLFSKGPKASRLPRHSRRRPVRRKLEQSTVGQYRNALLTMASALVANGVDADSLTRVRDLVSPERLNQVMTFLHHRADGLVTLNMLIIAVRARKLAEHCGLPREELEQLDELVAAVKEELPRRRGMTPKNKAVIDRLDDQRFRDLILLLPRHLVDYAKATRNQMNAARLVRAAVAIELLLVCAMRRENLIALELDRTIRRLGEGKNSYWVIDIAEHYVKNDEPLRYQLPRESAELLEYYLSTWRHLLCVKPTTWLFSERDGQHIKEKTMTSSVKMTSKRVLGVEITPHQFRHIAAELYLREHPAGLDIITQHLAHRDANTTRNYYARPKQREATRIYQDCVIIKRSEAAHRTQRRDRRPPKGQQEGDAL